jgi:DUF1680 family protein
MTVSASSAPVPPKGKRILKPFDYKGITLDDGFLKRQFDEVRNDYLRIPNDDLLKGFRSRAGLPAPGVEMGGWYSADVGNIFGQILSGLSRMYAATGDTACKEKVNTLVHEWGKCIASDGYFYYSANAPSKLYTYDKMVGGLVDVYLYCGNKEALTYLSKITGWAEQNLNRSREYANADGETSPRCGWSEWYTLPENLYRAYLATGDTKYKDFAEVWEYTEYWDLFAKNADIFGTRANGEGTGSYHSYSHVNTFSSAAATYLAKGETHYLDTLKNAYDFLQATQVYATGGFGPNEQLVPHDQVISALKEADRHFETQCGSWAAFKMSKYLISLTGDAKYGDWVERLIYNGIGASIPTDPSGHVFYYSVYSMGKEPPSKGRYKAGWACCSGTRPEAIADYNDLIYFKTDTDLYVNLYTPSTIRCNDVIVRQVTRFPESDTAEFIVAVKNPATFGLNLRVPGWLAGPMKATINGKSIALKTDKLHWITIKREWRSGDKLSVTLPMKLWLSRLDTEKGYPTAVMYGPVVLAFRSHAGDPTAKIDFEQLDKSLVPSAGEPLTYHLATDPDVLARPFYVFKEAEPYFIYFDPKQAP